MGCSTRRSLRWQAQWGIDGIMTSGANVEYPTGAKLALISLALCLSVFLNAPRLEDDRYSDNLKDIVAFCLQSDIEKRPKIEAVQKHSYISNTESQYPTATLASLVVAYKAWTDQGGYRKSLFQSGGVQEDVLGLAAPVYGDDWNFSATTTFDAQVSQLAPSLDIDGAYAGNTLDLRDETVRPQKAPIVVALDNTIIATAIPSITDQPWSSNRWAQLQAHQPCRHRGGADNHRRFVGATGRRGRDELGLQPSSRKRWMQTSGDNTTREDEGKGVGGVERTAQESQGHVR
ncbi:hypothetical protein HYFRA_00009498 [Hymenoscyphus fraxineus]|uniref:Uncharacterized protein n=1 Tax=Hymenoscyphus fraxineus TaxID=746836 RepID=A0A9N9KX82_9HELO|nr:hypothetical protein HYFRA_00009498 [Hymenoscyphus fraxineus]